MNKKAKSKETRGNEKWLAESEEKRKWAYGFLIEHADTTHYMDRMYRDYTAKGMLDLLDLMSEDQKAVEAISYMKAVWRQQKIDSDPNLKRVTMILQRSTVDKLDWLATETKRSRKKVIEDFVEDIETEKKEIRENYYKDKKEQIKNSQDVIDKEKGKLVAQVLKMNSQITKLRDQVDGSKKDIECLNSALKDALYNLAEIKVALEIDDILTIEATPDKQKEVSQEFNNLFSIYEERMQLFIKNQNRDFGKAVRRIRKRFRVD